MAQTGIGVPTYAYALNNPVRNSDPDGRYVRLGYCASWAEAVEVAKLRAGCQQQQTPLLGCGSQSNDSPCKQKMERCPSTRGCDLCSTLSDGRGPVLWIERGTLIPFSVPWAANNHAVTTYGGGKATNVRVAEGDCADVETLADTILHEAIHVCVEQTNEGTDDGAGVCDAETITNRCR